MTHDEYEQRKRRLEEELRAGVALLEMSFRHQIRALQLVWAAGGGDVEIPLLVMTLPEASRLLPAAPDLPAPPPTAPAPAPEARLPLPPGEAPGSCSTTSRPPCSRFLTSSTATTSAKR